MVPRGSWMKIVRDQHDTNSKTKLTVWFGDSDALCWLIFSWCFRRLSFSRIEIVLDTWSAVPWCAFYSLRCEYHTGGLRWCRSCVHYLDEQQGTTSWEQRIKISHESCFMLLSMGLHYTTPKTQFEGFSVQMRHCGSSWVWKYNKS